MCHFDQDVSLCKSRLRQSELQVTTRLKREQFKMQTLTEQWKGKVNKVTLNIFNKQEWGGGKKESLN